MTPSARLQAVLELLTLIDTVPRPADAQVSAYFRSRRYIGSKDRAAVSTMFYAMLRHQGRMNWWLAKKQHNPDVRLGLITYLRLVEGMTANQVEMLFDNKKFSPAFLNEDERKFLKTLEGHTLDHPSMPDDVAAECPPWAAESLRQRFGKNFKRELTAMLSPAPLDLRVNILKATRDAILIDFKKLRIKAEASPLSPYGIRVAERPALNALPMLKNGLVEIQDEGSQLVALMLDAKPGDRVVDFCAGAGGKTLAIAAEMKNKGHIVACDVMAGRLKRSTERYRRAGLHNIEVKPLKDERDPWVKKHKGGFDRVLVDAPCSGTGTWRRNPDARWRHLGPGLDKLLVMQAAILDSAARLVKPGGRLVYATCSLLPEENEKQVEAFLVAHPDFALVSAPSVLERHGIKPPADASAHYMSLTPLQDKTDGFFAAALDRVKTAADEQAEADKKEKSAKHKKKPKDEII